MLQSILRSWMCTSLPTVLIWDGVLSYRNIQVPEANIPPTMLRPKQWDSSEVFWTKRRFNGKWANWDGLMQAEAVRLLPKYLCTTWILWTWEFLYCPCMRL